MPLNLPQIKRTVVTALRRITDFVFGPADRGDFNPKRAAADRWVRRKLQYARAEWKIPAKAGSAEGKSEDAGAKSERVPYSFNAVAEWTLTASNRKKLEPVVRQCAIWIAVTEKRWLTFIGRGLGIAIFLLILIAPIYIVSNFISRFEYLSGHDLLAVFFGQFGFMTAATIPFMLRPFDSVALRQLILVSVFYIFFMSIVMSFGDSSYRGDIIQASLVAAAIMIGMILLIAVVMYVFEFVLDLPPNGRLLSVKPASDIIIWDLYWMLATCWYVRNSCTQRSARMRLLRTASRTHALLLRRARRAYGPVQLRRIDRVVTANRYRSAAEYMKNSVQRIADMRDRNDFNELVRDLGHTMVAVSEERWEELPKPAPVSASSKIRGLLGRLAGPLSYVALALALPYFPLLPLEEGQLNSVRFLLLGMAALALMPIGLDSRRQVTDLLQSHGIAGR
ncbi:hypothetical protein AB0B28_07250 [Glycomyces sp. NPDC046736]|uniref:hypothetical protein n=1 Tax=Glycomyces sp. NPDC046736 TaxID=3155615 RepID=UPI0033E03700